MDKKLIASAALAAALSTLVVAPASAAGKEKCYGIAGIAQNDCGNLAGTHSCAGLSTVDKDPGEWKLVDKGTCESLGGMLKAEARALYEASKQDQANG